MRTPFSLSRRASLPLAALLLSAAPLPAIIVTNGPIELHEIVLAEGNVGTVEDRVGRELFPTLPQSSEILIQFPMGAFNRKVFSSALAEGTGNIEVRVDNLGARLDDPIHTSSRLGATARYVAQIVNNSDDPVQIRFVFVIPGGEIQLLDPQISSGIFDLFANVEVEITTQIGLADPITQFLFGLQLSGSGEPTKIPTGAVQFHDESDPAHPELHKFSIDPFNGDLLFPGSVTASVDSERDATPDPAGRSRRHASQDRERRRRAASERMRCIASVSWSE